MNPVTLRAFNDELESIAKEAGVKDALKAATKPLEEAYVRHGAKVAITGDTLLDNARKLPIVGKKLKNVSISSLQEMANKALL